MTVAKKQIKRIIISSIRERNKPYKESKLRKHVNKKLHEIDGEEVIELSTEVFNEIVSKLVKKGKVLKDGEKFFIPKETDVETVEMCHESSDETETRPTSNDFQEDERNIVNIANNSSNQVTLASSPSSSAAASKYTNISSSEETLPKVAKEDSNSILLFYEYCEPIMTRAEQDAAIAHCYSTLSTNGVTGRLRVGREGFNGTLTGPYRGIRVFTASLRTKYPSIFGETDFKYVDNQPTNQLLKGLKVWPVTEIVTYGFDPKLAPLEMTGTHLTPQEFHEAMADPRSVVIDVRNFNETLIGKFAPPNLISSSSSSSSDDNNNDSNNNKSNSKKNSDSSDSSDVNTMNKKTPNKTPAELLEGEKVLDPLMRRSTEFPEWVEKNRHKLEGKRVLMYCTGGVRCERASAYVRNLGIKDVSQLEGGIHRYLEAFPKDGGFW